MPKINLNPTFKATVEARTDALSVSFEAVFKAKKLSEITDLQVQAQAEGGDAVLNMLSKVAESWDVEGEDGKPIEKGLPGLQVLCNYPGVGQAMLQAFYRGHNEVTAKN